MAKCNNCKKQNMSEWYSFTFKKDYQTSGDQKVYCHDCLHMVRNNYKDHLAVIKHSDQGMLYLCIWCEEEVSHEQWRVDSHNSKCNKRKQALNQKPDNSREREREREQSCQFKGWNSAIRANC